MPKTIKEVLEQIDHMKTEHYPEGNPFKPGGLSVNEALAEIRQLLKEAEPTTPNHNVFDRVSRDAYKAAVVEYTANIEKRLG